MIIFKGKVFLQLVLILLSKTRKTKEIYLISSTLSVKKRIIMSMRICKKS